MTVVSPPTGGGLFQWAAEAVARGELALARLLSPAVEWIRSRELVRVELATVVIFHAVGAVIIAAAPGRYVETPAMAVLLYMADRWVWALVFAAAAVASGACWWSPTGPLQLVTWLLVFPTGAAWVGCFALALPYYGGNALVLVAWPVFLTLWAVTAARLILRTGDGECGRTW